MGMKIKASLLVNINIQMIKLAGKTQILKRSTDDIMCFFLVRTVLVVGEVRDHMTPEPPISSSTHLNWNYKILLFSRSKQEM